MQKGFLDSDGRGGNHKKKDGISVGIDSIAEPVELSDNLTYPVLKSLANSNGESDDVVNILNVDLSSAKPNNCSVDPTNALIETSGPVPKESTKETRSYARIFKGESSGKSVDF